MDTEQGPPAVSKGYSVVILICGILVIIDALYLTTVHYAKVPLFCSTTGIINCAEVTQSSYSVIPGTTIPITIPGMAWGLVSALLALSMLASRRGGARAQARVMKYQLIWSGIGMLTVFYLVFAEIDVLRHICEWCTAVHILVLATLLTAVAEFQTIHRAIRVRDAKE